MRELGNPRRRRGLRYVALATFMALTACSQNPGVEMPVILAAPEIQEAAPAAPFQVTVRNVGRVPAADVLVHGGYPFPAGAVASEDSLALKDREDRRLPLQARPLAFWPDGSVKWAVLTFILPRIEAEETLTLHIVPAAEAGATAGAELPPGLTYTLSTDGEEHPFAPKKDAWRYQGAISSERVYSGEFDSQTGTAATLSVTAFSGYNAVKYVFGIKQLTKGGTWNGLKARLPHKHVHVHNGAHLQTHVSAVDGQSEVAFISEGHVPVDTGVGRQWEVWGFDEEEKFQGLPLIPEAAPQYLGATGALGRYALDVPDAWAKTFDESVALVFKKRDANPLNFGWQHYGDFYDREHGLAYFGFLSQEYDPATALVLGYARTGRLEYFAAARDLAESFRDLSVSPVGGVYQHRATIHAMEAHIAGIVEENLERAVRGHPGFNADMEAVSTVLNDLYGAKFGDVREPIREIVAPLAHASFEEQLAEVLGQVTMATLDEALNEFRRNYEAEARRSGDTESSPGIKDIAQVYAQDKLIRSLGFTDADSQFEDFFARYGGSWDNFPAFRVDLLDARKKHEGGHSLAEMLVRMYCFTGDESYKETALLIARHQLDVLVPYVLEQNRNSVSNSDSIHTRQLSWPLILLVSVWELTEVAEPALHAEIVEACGQLAQQLAKNKPQQHQGGIHAGVGMEALARYHEKTGDPEIAAFLVRWARYWASTQWDNGQGFRYIHDEDGTGDTSMTALILFGLAYAHNLSPDEALRARVLEARDLLVEAGPANYAKTLAMSYRSSPRALEIISRWPGE